MKTTNNWLIIALLPLFFLSSLLWADDKSKATAHQEQEKPLIQIAILLDTSNSMDGLINQARSQLWKIVNELATTKRNGQIPSLQIALYEYGKSSLSSDEGYLRLVVGLTTDLDKVSEELFALKTNGGQEYCGWVIDSAVKELGWSSSNKDYKAIFIAGNEPFTQGPINYKESCQKALKKSIIVNTIHCGSHQAGVSGEWEKAALMSDGKYLNIDQNQEIVDISAPQDQKIMELNQKLNQTYKAYGETGRRLKQRQSAQDQQAKSMSQGSMVQRAVSKSSAYYKNTQWDLVDAVKEGKVDLSKVKDEELPKEMQGMGLEEKKAYLDKLAQERQQIQERIKKLNKARKQYVAEKRKEMAQESTEATLDKVMIDSLHEQLQEKSFEIEK